ncbi:MAG: peptidoglycan DD-metalloendopeptidase family protein, partial [Alphaproteobacteria bacterium]
CMLRAYGRNVVDAVNACPEMNTFIPALAYLFARSPTEITVSHAEREAGERARQASAEARPFAEARGRARPPAAGRLVANWGQPDAGGTASRGMALEVAPEATIVSPWHGTIAYAGPFRGYGVILIVDSGDGYHWFVTGFGRLDVAPGQPVRAGEPVGQAPGAGAARPVVYVELRRNGQPVDPAPWVALPNGKVGG